MASKRKPVSADTKLQALDEVDKKLNLTLKLLKNILSHVAHCQTDEEQGCLEKSSRNTSAPCLPFVAKHQAIHGIKQPGYFH